MGSLPDSKYIIQTDGYYFVESHDVDPSKGYITVSAKGIVNGLSNIPNDGADFGPDTYNPNYSGSGIPYTQTSGIQEAVNYAISNYQTYTDLNGTLNVAINIKLGSGIFKVSNSVNINPFTSTGSIQGIGIYGQDQMTSYVEVATNGSLFVVSPNYSSGVDITIANMQPSVPNGYNPSSIIEWLSTQRNAQFLILQHLNGSGAGWKNGTVYVSNLESVIMIDHERYQTGVNIDSCLYVSDFAGTNAMGAYTQTISGAQVISKITNCAEVNIDGSWIGWYDFGGSKSVKIRGNSFQGFALSSDVDEVVIDASGNYVTVSQTNPPFFYNASSGTVTINQLFVRLGYWFQQSDVIFDNGSITYNNIQVSLYEINNSTIPSSLIIPRNTPTISPNPPVSATAYQNTNPYDIRIYLPAYATTSGTAGTVAIALGSTSSPTAIGTKFISGSTSSSSTDILELVVPAGWYYEYTLTGVTLATATVVAA